MKQLTRAATLRAQSSPVSPPVSTARGGVAAAVLTLVLAFAMGGIAVAEPQIRQISVTGEGRAETAPDVATLTLGVTNEAREAAAAMAATSGAVTRILARLTELGIAARDMQTQRFSLSPVWSNRNDAANGPARITGFVASNMVMVRVRDLDALGGLLDAVISDGANDFRGLRFSVQEQGPLREAARRDAVADARARAEVLADAAGVTLGAVRSITEHGGGRPAQMMEMASARDASVPIAAGEVAVTTSVSMVFDIAE